MSYSQTLADWMQGDSVHYWADWADDRNKRKGNVPQGTSAQPPPAPPAPPRLSIHLTRCRHLTARWRGCLDGRAASPPEPQHLMDELNYSQKADLKTIYHTYSRQVSVVTVTEFCLQWWWHRRAFQYLFINSGLCLTKLYLGHQRHCLLFQRATSRQTRCSSVGNPSPWAGGLWVMEGRGRSSVSSVWEVVRVVWWQAWWPRWSCSPRTEEKTGGLIPQPGTDTQPELQPACTVKHRKHYCQTGYSSSNGCNITTDTYFKTSVTKGKTIDSPPSLACQKWPWWGRAEWQQTAAAAGGSVEVKGPQGTNPPHQETTPLDPLQKEKTQRGEVA